MSKRENFPSQRKYNTFSSNTTNKSNDSPSSLERATDILLCLGNGINSATEIADYCEYSISTVHRLLQSLTDLGWVIQDDTSHKYFIGSLVHKLSANLATSHRYLVLHALKEMSRLANLTQETVILGGMDQFNFLRLHDIPSPHNLRIIEASDKLKGQYLGATAKVLLSQIDDKELKKFLTAVSRAVSCMDLSPETKAPKRLPGSDWKTDMDFFSSDGISLLQPWIPNRIGSNKIPEDKKNIRIILK